MKYTRVISNYSVFRQLQTTNFKPSTQGATSYHSTVYTASKNKKKRNADKENGKKKLPKDLLDSDDAILLRFFTVAAQAKDGVASVLGPVKLVHSSVHLFIPTVSTSRVVPRGSCIRIILGFRLQNRYRARTTKHGNSLESILFSTILMKMGMQEKTAQKSGFLPFQQYCVFTKDERTMVLDARSGSIQMSVQSFVEF